MTHFENPKMEFFSKNQTTLTKLFMGSQRKPITNIVRNLGDGLWAMDSDSSPFHSNVEILMEMGKVLERMYTMDIDRFNKAFLEKDDNGYLPAEEGLVDDDYHRYFMLNDNICLRSQIDCQSTLPDGKKIVYEVKTRAVAPIRYDLSRYDQFFDYKIDRTMGYHSSYEREYYDLIRGGFLKYFFQLKIGNMHGAMIAYHNTLRHFGFEYVTLEDMETALFGDSFRADQMFVLLNKLLTTLLDNVIEHLKDETFSFFRVGKFNKVSTHNQQRM
jgi:hypothetical protein